MVVRSESVGVSCLVQLDVPAQDMGKRPRLQKSRSAGRFDGKLQHRQSAIGLASSIFLEEILVPAVGSHVGLLFGATISMRPPQSNGDPVGGQPAKPEQTCSTPPVAHGQTRFAHSNETTTGASRLPAHSDVVLLVMATRMWKLLKCPYRQKFQIVLKQISSGPRRHRYRLEELCRMDKIEKICFEVRARALTQDKRLRLSMDLKRVLRSCAAIRSVFVPVAISKCPAR